AHPPAQTGGDLLRAPPRQTGRRQGPFGADQRRTTFSHQRKEERGEQRQPSCRRETRDLRSVRHGNSSRAGRARKSPSLSGPAKRRTTIKVIRIGQVGCKTRTRQEARACRRRSREPSGTSTLSGPLLASARRDR